MIPNRDHILEVMSEQTEEERNSSVAVYDEGVNNFMIVCFSFNVITPDAPPNISLGLFSIKSGSVFNCYGGSLLNYHIQIDYLNILSICSRS